MPAPCEHPGSSARRGANRRRSLGCVPRDSLSHVRRESVRGRLSIQRRRARRLAGTDRDPRWARRSRHRTPAARVRAARRLRRPLTLRGIRASTSRPAWRQAATTGYPEIRFRWKVTLAPAVRQSLPAKSGIRREGYG